MTDQTEQTGQTGQTADPFGGRTLSPGRLDSLTGLRFIAASFVFFFHVSLAIFIPFSNKQAEVIMAALFGNGGWFGVSLFFVLSGFVLTWTAKPQIQYRAFWRKRLCKIFPTQIATWLITLLLVALPTTSALVAVANLLLVHTWVPVHSFYMSVDSANWSLCSELLFYLLFPFILPMIRRIPHKYLIAAGVALFAASLAIDFIAQLLPASPQAPEGPISVLRYWLIYYLPISRLPEFLLGMIACRIARETRLVRVHVGLAALLVAAAYALDYSIPFSFRLVPVEMLPIAILICSLARADSSRVTGLLRSRPFIWLGNVSFGFYMSQAPVLAFLRWNVMGYRTYSIIPAIGVTVGLFAVTLTLGALLHHFIEVPVMNRWSKPRPRVGVPLGTAT